ncbi:hypothetical protein SERLA73DRAFT_100436 [Serpula lacrymans var. lacrymans S7.3]|uniref:Uncharacterized protein n=1 Tax=Serpula lacrymans var. lacrymans (strain S7.3) TaxID=936435 RepID=F8PFA0_SERL3|nr:hypothetical protein SERLA73DRAFT_100436 [Serpula lacrymans var. lacrymans S7.3]
MSSSGPPESLQYAFYIPWVGANMSALLYGGFLVISLTNLRLLYKKRYNLYLVYTIILISITTIYMGVSINYGAPQLISIIYTANAESTYDLSVWPEVVVGAAFVVNTWFTDAFLLYRCYVIWTGWHYVVTLPILFYLGSIGSSIAFLWSSAHPGSVYSTHAVQEFVIPYWSLSVAVNVTASCLIAIRLLRHKKMLAEAISVEHGTPYINIIAMTVESAALYAVFAIIALVLFVLNSPLTNVFLPMLGNIQVIAPSLIIYRIARGISFSSHHFDGHTTSDIRFASNENGTEIETANSSLPPRHGTMNLQLIGQTDSSFASNSVLSKSEV